MLHRLSVKEKMRLNAAKAVTNLLRAKVIAKKTGKASTQRVAAYQKSIRKFKRLAR